jgi:hypothetical protein
MQTTLHIEVWDLGLDVKWFLVISSISEPTSLVSLHTNELRSRSKDWSCGGKNVVTEEVCRQQFESEVHC